MTWRLSITGPVASGGELLMRKDLLELAKYATDKGMRAVISTNGTLITKDIAAELKKSACRMSASASMASADA